MNRPGSPTFGPDSTALEVVAGIDLFGQTALVTGASSGIGAETARALAAAGATVTLAVRDLEAGERTASYIRASVNDADVRVAHLDLADLSTVRALGDAWSGPLHLLINNAGIMHTPESRTPAGWELQFAVNHLGHFALAQVLLPALTEAQNARIVAVSSSGHGSSGIRFDDPFFERDDYDRHLAYGQSKTANVLFSLEATRRWTERGIAAAALMPGGIWTNLQRHWDPEVLADMQRRFPTKTPQQGAATTVYVATRALLGPGTPTYYEDCRPAEVVAEIVDGLHGVVPHALDPASARKLWELSEQLLGDEAARPAEPELPTWSWNDFPTHSTRAGHRVHLDLNGWTALIAYLAGPEYVCQRTASYPTHSSDGGRLATATDEVRAIIHETTAEYLAHAGVPEQPFGVDWEIRLPHGVDERRLHRECMAAHHAIDPTNGRLAAQRMLTALRGLLGEPTPK
ncbi:SDR family NAD(P)-dependent oxidoreductase [Pseudoclavibacter helvolus]|uniref:SDR family NAD(P)-dependent oxidoreductase n=1 Tax=Pseudoclavibacter helvolus TaxID=255205 RepID=UPI003C73A89F